MTHKVCVEVVRKILNKVKDDPFMQDETYALVYLLSCLERVDRLLHNNFTPELVEKHFPKGECKERGQAIVLHAEMLIYITEFIQGGSKC